MEDAVLVDGLRRNYGTRIALDGVSFGVHRGETFGLLGPNGGGKTTLFRILTTLLDPTSGRALIFGKDVLRARPAVRRMIGVVFQSPSLDIYLTARENLRHGGHLYGLSGATLDARISDNMARFGVADRANDRVKQLSGGLRRRVELSKCLLHQPPLLIMDEATNGLDPAARRDVWDHLEKLRRDTGLTILLTTHDMEEAERCTRLLILDKGRAVACGSPDELRSQIAHKQISIATDDPTSLLSSIAEKFNVTPQLRGNSVLLADDRGPEFPGELLAAFGDSIKSLTIARPTLGDVFLHMTGRSLDAEGAAP